MKFRKAMSMLVVFMFLSTNTAVPAVFAEEYVRNLEITQSSTLLDNTSISFTDLDGFSWAIPAIESMASKGVVSGIGGNKYAPANNVTRLEFASMAIRATAGGVEGLERLSSEAGNLSEIESLNGEFWGNSTISVMDSIGLSEYFGKDKEEWNRPATRAEMAYIVINVAEKLGEENFEVKEGIQNNISDYSTFSNMTKYLQPILKAYSNGIISGMNEQGEFAPNKNARRAEAAVMMWRLLEADKRANVEVKEPTPVVVPVEEGENVMADGTIYPKEGDIGPDGRPITRDPETGVLGYGNGQMGGIYLGVEMGATGATIKVNKTAKHDYDGMSGSYEDRNGYVYWGGEWTKIDNNVKGKLNASNPPSDSNVGLQADIEGNIITSDSDAIPMYEVKQLAPGFNLWSPLGI